jgi:hypothetical protein
MFAFRARGVACDGLERGQFKATQNELAISWGWHLMKVRRFLLQLQKESMITVLTPQPTHRATHKATLITICNYEAYQPRATHKATPQPTHKPTLPYINNEKEGEIREKGSAALASLGQPTDQNISPPSTPDPRRKPLWEFMESEYHRITGLELKAVFDVADGVQMAKMLARCSEKTYPLEKLKRAWTSFLTSKDKWDREKIGEHPAAFFATRVNRFLPRKTEEMRELKFEKPAA